MTIWLLLVFAVLISANPKEAQYECGEHGRFEYCIDGIPGCVIGCHCHPGYYFDTDTKICEPNSNLLETYRRQYAAEPTRISISQMDIPELMPQTPSPAPNVIDDHVDNIAKNADDLGDWLYNQFYKTIESQVINNTNSNGITRRSGKISNLNTNTKKRRKSDRRGSSKKKLKQDDLRRKLLRITEDDSLFDSNSETDSSDDSSSSKEEDESDKKGHGHKKFVIVNKKPKPPLPSFVFLPNIETPFYPPVALPPPVLPMYPMVPVPPVLPGFPAPNMVHDCEEKSSPPETTSSPATVAAVTAASSAASTEQPSVADTTTDVITTISQAPATLRKNKRKKMLMYNSGMDPLRRLRQLVQNSGLNKIQQKTQVDPIEETDQSSAEIQDTLQIDPFVNPELQHRTNTKSPLMDNDIANFKYLSELIHRVNFNETDKAVVPRLKPMIRNRKPLIINQKKTRIPILPPKIEDPSRRLNIELYPQETKTLDDTFYSKLGKQIATLIRGVDSKNNRQIDIEIEHLDQNTPSYPIFSELSYAPHSYWERFARSPKNYLEQYRKKNEHSKKSNENLYNIEDKVEFLASTMLPLSLQEIENFIKGIPESEEDAQKYHQSCNKTLNINLWPEEPPAVIPYHAKAIINKSPPHFNYAKKNTSENRSKLKGFRMQNVYSTWVDVEHSPQKTPTNKVQNIRVEKITDDKNKKIIITKMDIPISKKQKKKLNYGKIPARQFTLTPTRRSHKATVLKSLSPFDYNKKFVDDNNPFYDKTEEFKYPVENSANKRGSKHSKSKRPSYFHHEVHHFNYID
ncbi:hypothetical protein RR46_05586 [Papilio xuthus]|uniref:Chitin-binding type-2 domain-containing protein n=1 Tax=Papilio xuthus TaxID=66420 RepID=A0A194PW32_PAPXU|nr:hypothetical protein RR46_05586 [Papilio xuthus]